MNTKNYAKRLRAAADALDELNGKPTPTHKQELLSHYATGTPTLFKQFDAWTRYEDSAGNLCIGKDSHCVVQSDEYELRHSGHVARLQIRSGTPAALAVVLVQEILNDVKALVKSEGATAFTLREHTRRAPSGFDDFDDEIPF